MKQYISYEERVRRLKYLFAEQAKIEAEIKFLIVEEKKKQKVSDENDDGKIHYFQEVMAVFKENASQSLNASKVAKLVEKRTGREVDIASIKATITYAYNKKDIHRVERGKYRLKQENMPEIKMQQPVET